MPFLLDAAQSIGAVPTDMEQLGLRVLRGLGTKWLCGPEGSGALYRPRSDQLDELTAPWPGYGSLADATDALELRPGAGRRPAGPRFPAWDAQRLGAGVDLGVGGRRLGVGAHPRGRARGLTRRAAVRARTRGRAAGRSTLVSWKVDDPDAEVARLAEAGVVVRSILSHGLGARLGRRLV